MLLKSLKILRGYHKTHFDKNLQKQIIITSYLRNKANKSKGPIDIPKFSEGGPLL